MVDPEDEYRRLAETVGGAYVHLGAPGVRVNPFDLAPGPDALTRRALFVHTLIAVLLGGKPDPASTAALDRGIVAAYESVGITADPRSHARPAPLLRDLAAAAGVPTVTPPLGRWLPGWRRSPPAPTGDSSTGRPPPAPTATSSSSACETYPAS